MAKKLASELVPGDKLESSSGVVTVVRAHVMWPKVSVIVTGRDGSLSPWAHYDAHDQFETVTLH